MPLIRALKYLTLLTYSLPVLIEELIASNPQQVKQYRGGKTKVIGFFVGQMMKKTQGKGDPAVINHLLKKRLDE